MLEDTYHARMNHLAANLVINAFPSMTAMNIAALLDLLATHPDVDDGVRLILKLSRDAALHLGAIIKGMEQRKVRESPSPPITQVIWPERKDVS